jgi:hypothetical protein
LTADTPYYGYCVIKNELVEEAPSKKINKNNKSDCVFPLKHKKFIIIKIF